MHCTATLLVSLSFLFSGSEITFGSRKIPPTCTPTLCVTILDAAAATLGVTVPGRGTCKCQRIVCVCVCACVRVCVRVCVCVINIQESHWEHVIVVLWGFLVEEI